jgi:hypothetical protein
MRTRSMTGFRRVSGITLMLLALALAMTAIGARQQPAAGAASKRATNVDKYLGKWNYDQPDRASMTNIIVLNLPSGRLLVPQVGDIVFTSQAPGRVVGRTDVGCTWTFSATPDSLKLDPPDQLCRNPTLNLSYTITKWTVTVAGRHERETIIATSHQPGGDVDGALERGMRTKVKEYDPAAAAKFAGTWAYDQADPDARVNIRLTRGTGPDGEPTTVASPERGLVTIARDYENRITARTDDGCAWTLLARGNTAKLDPPTQTCRVSASAFVTLGYWTITTDGSGQATMMAGTDEHGADFTLTVGSLHKR